MNYRKYSHVALLIGSLVMLTACTRSISDVNSEGKTENPVFPDKSDAVRTEGSFVNTDNLKQMRPGLTKAQVYELIGAPHFSEGVLRVKEWNYIFHFTMADKTVRTCQYKVLFDSDMKAQSVYFLPENCLTPQTPLKQVKTVAPIQKELNAESLFAFGSANLSPEGVEQVSALATELNTEDYRDAHIIVTGHTDRIGRPDANLALSEARADSVKNLLIEKGLPAGKIETRGVGDEMPRVYCPGNASPAVIKCLAPNRRMTLDIVTNTAGN